METMEWMVKDSLKLGKPKQPQQLPPAMQINPPKPPFSSPTCYSHSSLSTNTFICKFKDINSTKNLERNPSHIASEETGTFPTK